MLFFSSKSKEYSLLQPTQSVIKTSKSVLLGLIDTESDDPLSEIILPFVM